VDTTFNELAARFEATLNSMGRFKTPGDIRRFIDRRLHGNKTAWTVEQRHWIANAAQKSSNWEHISNEFNQYFRAPWSSEDLKLFHQSLVEQIDPAKPDHERSSWARDRPLAAKLHFVHSSRKRWSAEELKLLFQLKAENKSFMEIAIEFNATFGINRTSTAVEGRWRMHSPKSPMPSVWTSEQESWLVSRAYDGNKSRSGHWEDLAILFETRFEFRRIPSALRHRTDIFKLRNSSEPPRS
jgi:hypothetical protein